jgi:hypothetical protein
MPGSTAAILAFAPASSSALAQWRQRGQTTVAWRRGFRQPVVALLGLPWRSPAPDGLQERMLLAMLHGFNSAKGASDFVFRA